MKRTLRAGVIGAGSLGRYHAQKYTLLEGVTLTGVADIDFKRARDVAAQNGARATTDFRELLGEVDLVSVVVPTESHFDVARVCLEAGLHVLVEKPMASSLSQADQLIAIAERTSVVLCVGHLERFNPAFMDLRGMLDRPFFVEAERLGGFKGRGTDVDVVLDLMIHDIDLVLAMMPAKVASVSACGFQVLTDLVDIANARIEFEDGAVADLSASRVSRSPVRKLRVFGTNFYASADLNVPDLKVERRPGSAKPASDVLTYPKPDALLREIEEFVAAVESRDARLVTGQQGRAALALALEINDAISRRIERFSRAQARVGQ
jgi:predicted dehydrogenase